MVSIVMNSLKGCNIKTFRNKLYMKAARSSKALNYTVNITLGTMVIKIKFPIPINTLNIQRQYPELENNCKKGYRRRIAVKVNSGKKSLTTLKHNDTIQQKTHERVKLHMKHGNTPFIIERGGGHKLEGKLHGNMQQTNHAHQKCNETEYLPCN